MKTVLNVVGGAEGIIRRCAFNTDRDLRTDFFKCCDAASLTDFFLRGQRTDNSGSQLFAGQSAKDFQNNGTADPIIESFAQGDLVLLVIFKFYRRNSRTSWSDMEYFFHFFPGDRADIDYKLRDIQRFIPLCCTGKMRRFAGDHTGNQISVLRQDPDFGSRDIGGKLRTDGDHLHGSVVTDRLDHITDFIGMSVQHQNRAIIGRILSFTVKEKVPDRILVHMIH